MKKQVSKITLKTDTIVSLSKAQANNVVGGQQAPEKPSRGVCTSNFCQP